MKCWSLKLSITLGRASSLYSLLVAVKRPANLTSRTTASTETRPSSAYLPAAAVPRVCNRITPPVEKAQPEADNRSYWPRPQAQG